MDKYKKHLIQDFVIIGTSIFVAMFLARTGFLINNSFVAGLFFTSIFTTAPAIVNLGRLAQENSIFFTALFGAFGALTGDIIIFKFIRDRFSEDLMGVFRHDTRGKRLKALFHLKIFRWLSVLLAGLIIASPLPDELGIGLLGFSKFNISLLVPLSFAFNFLGIYIIGTLARALI